MSEWAQYGILGGASFLASLISASLSVGGGYILFGALTLVFPLSYAIALQPVVSYSSLVSRSIGFRDAIDWRIVRPFTFGSLFGVAIGLAVFAMVSERALALAVGAAMLALTWTRPSVNLAHRPAAVAIVGGLHALTGTVLGMGAVLQSYLVNLRLDPRAVVGTFASCLLLLEAMRGIGYAAGGFAYWNHWPMIVIVSIAGVLGTLAGRGLTGKVPEVVFFWMMRIAVTALALRLMALGLGLLN